MVKGVAETICRKYTSFMRLPFKRLEPFFFAGLVDDPLLLLQVRPLGRSLLFDCGQLHHLAKRVLRSIDAVFVSHAHMDHFMGIDTLIRHILVAPRTIELFGPPGIADKLVHKLSSYDWNLAENFWCSLRVREIHPGRLRNFLLAGPEGFCCRPEGEESLQDATIYRNRYLSVASAVGDHKIPVLFYRVTETAGFSVDEERLRGTGLLPGPWLGELKELFLAQRLNGIPLKVGCRGHAGDEQCQIADAATVYEAIRKKEPTGSIGYFTDLGFTSENRQKLVNLLRNVTLLIGECAYLRQDVGRARASYHLCSADLNALLDDLRPTFFLPMHLSKTYLGQNARLYEELEPPPGTTILRLPEHLTPRPLLPADLPPQARGRTSP
jgi:ribonuclease Z